MMKLYHTSPSAITKIHANGMFGDCLFFNAEVYSMSVGEVHVYSIEIEEDDVIDVCDFDADDAPATLARVQAYFECDQEQALAYLTAEEIAADPEADWWIQGMQGAAAKEAGYKAARSEDEQGTVYIVPMLGRESDLILEGTDV